MKKKPAADHLREAWVLFFFLGVVMLNYPFLQIVNKTNTILGIPLLVIYFLVGWPASIVVVYLFTRRLDKNSEAVAAHPEKGAE